MNIVLNEQRLLFDYFIKQEHTVYALELDLNCIQAIF
jgi:hypothetical protein